MTPLTPCFDGGVRYSFDVILFIPKEFSAASPALKKGFVGSGIPGPEELPAILFSAPSLGISVNSAPSLRKLHTPFLSRPQQFPPGFPLANPWKSLLLLQGLVLQRSPSS